MDRHRHRSAYVAVVIAGRYQEAGDAGRFDVSPGDVLIHQELDAHLNLFPAGTVEVLNLPLVCPDLAGSRLRLTDLDEVAKLAESDIAAAAWLASRGEPCLDRHGDWPDILADELRTTVGLSLQTWAEVHGLHPSTVSRGFRQAYGTTPRRYQAEARTRRAVRLIRSSHAGLASIAYEAGFADQAHLCRGVRAMTDMRPSQLRHH